MSASNFLSYTPPTGGSTSRTRYTDEELAERNLRNLGIHVRRRLRSMPYERILELRRLIPSSRGGSAPELNTESPRSNGGSTTGAPNMYEHLDALIQGLLEPQEQDSNEPEKLEALRRALAPFVPFMCHSHPFVSVSDLPVEERICCICRLDFCVSVDYSDTTTEVHDEEYRDLCVPIRLRCGHIVGDNCIGLWVDHSLERGLDGRCPFCRTIIRRGYFQLTG